MRLYELTFPTSIQKAGEILKDAGYEEISTDDNAYGKVFHKPGQNSVLKLYDDRDHAFTLFVDFCRNQTNIHFPRYSRSSVKIKGTNYSAVRTELLKVGGGNTLSQAARWGEEIAKYGCPINQHDLKFAEFKRDFPQKSKEYIPWLNANMSLAEAFMLLRNHFLKNRTISFDIHEDNMMMRGDVIVIIDPVAPKR